MPFLSVIIPAYNESERLPETLRMVREYLERQNFTYEVLLIDDGSTDTTVKLAEKISADFPALKVVKNAQNKGKGGVVRQGMLMAKGEWRLFMDADHATPISEFDKFIPELGNAEVIIGSRYLHPDSIKVRQPLKRRIGSRGFNWLVQRSILPGIVDTQCGFKAFSAKAAEDIFPLQSLQRWAFDAEILTIANELGYKIIEVPVDWYDATASRFRARQAVAQLLHDLKVIRHKVKTKQYRHEPTS